MTNLLTPDNLTLVFNRSLDLKVDKEVSFRGTDLTFTTKLIQREHYQEIAVYVRNFRGVELDRFELSPPAGYAPKYARPPKPEGRDYIRPRQALVRRFVPIEFAEKTPRVSPDLHEVLGEVWWFGSATGNDAGGQGVAPLAAPNEWAADLAIEHMPIVCRDTDRPEAYYRGVNGWNGVGWNQTVQLSNYCKKRPGWYPGDDIRVPININEVTVSWYSTLMAIQPFDYQHLERGIEELDPKDPIHALFLEDMCRDISFAWDQARENTYMSGPSGMPSDIGREVAWCLMAATKGRNKILGDRFKRIIIHEKNTLGIPQAMSFGYGGLAPDPWLYCAVDRSVRVAQRMEMEHLCLQEWKAGMNVECERLGMTLLRDPNPMKWINADTGKGVGNFPRDWFPFPEAWAATYRASEALGKSENLPFILNEVLKSRIPDKLGSVRGYPDQVHPSDPSKDGPWPSLQAVLDRYMLWNNPGQTREACKILREILRKS